LDAEQIYVSFSGYRFGEDVGHVFQSVNYGTEWKDISYNLPEVPVNDLLIHPTRGEIYAATDIGIYYLHPETELWTLLGIGMPVVPVTDMDFDEGEDLLLAATYGRSMYSYRFDFSTSQQELTSNIGMTIYPSPAPSGGRLTVEASSQIKSIDLLSFTGQSTSLLTDYELSTAQVQLPEVPSGSYVIRCHTAAGVESRIFTVE